jgi:hypothetical protein
VSRRPAIEAALAAWREAERLLAEAPAGHEDGLKALVDLRRDQFQELSAAHMADQIDRLKAAEQLRSASTPSTKPFHEAAKLERELAAEIWDGARMSDEETPKSAS